MFNFHDTNSDKYYLYLQKKMTRISFICIHITGSDVFLIFNTDT